MYEVFFRSINTCKCLNDGAARWRRQTQSWYHTSVMREWSFPHLSFLRHSALMSFGAVFANDPLAVIMIAMEG